MYTYTNIQLWACTATSQRVLSSFSQQTPLPLFGLDLYHVPRYCCPGSGSTSFPLPAWPWLLHCSERLPWALGACTVTLVPLPALMGCAGLIQREICDGTHSGPGWTPLEPSLRLQQWLESRARTVQPEHRTPALSMGLMPCPADLQLFLNSKL